MPPPSTPDYGMNRRVIFTDYHYMDNVQSVHKWLHLYLVILFLLFVSRILVFNFMLMPVKIRRYRAIIIIMLLCLRHFSNCVRKAITWRIGA